MIGSDRAVRITFMALGSTEEGVVTCDGLGVRMVLLLPGLGRLDGKHVWKEKRIIIWWD